MDGTIVVVFLLGAFLGGFISGLSGFAMGLVLSGIWLHVLTPLQTASLIVGYGLVTQGYAIWKVRRALSWRAVAPLILGAAAGVPVGTLLVTQVDPAALRWAIGALLVAYATYSLARPAFKVRSAMAAEVGVGVLNGTLGGLTGLTGITATVWCQLRALPKDAQRAVFQPVNFATAAMTGAALSVAGGVTSGTVELYLLGLPLLLLGLWGGFALYGKLDESAFRKLMLGLLLASGLALVIPG